MSRIAWTRYEGNDVEAVVAMLINREHPNSVRITPSAGDGGVDILNRGAAPGGGDVVYQVKRYTAPLTSKQKEEVEASLDRLLSDPRWSALEVGTWLLVTPWDPTPEAEAWLRGLGEARQLPVVWRGLAHVEQLAAKYPEVIDYYLEGGRSQIKEAYEAVSAYFGVDPDPEPLDVPSVAARISKATKLLDADPHYRYELRFGAGEPTGPPSTPGLVMTWIRSSDTGRQWIAVDIIARCAASVVERPITVKGRFRADPDSDFARALRDFVDYGVPFTTPAGGFEGTIDAPGGLGGVLVGGVARVLPVEGNAGSDPELLVESLDSSLSVIASTELLRTELSEGQQGVRVVLQQRNRVFEIEDRRDPTTGAGKRLFRFGDCAGEPVLAVRDAFRFLATCRPPNSVRLSRRMAGSASGSIDPAWTMPFPDAIDETIASIKRMVDVLAALQQHTAVVVRVPNLFAVTEQQFAEWERAANILQGQAARVSYPEGHALLIELAVDVESTEGALAVSLPFEVSVGEQMLNFGTVEVHLDDATLVERKEVPGGFLCKFTTPDRTATFRLPGRAE